MLSKCKIGDYRNIKSVRGKIILDVTLFEYQCQGSLQNSVLLCKALTAFIFASYAFLLYLTSMITKNIFFGIGFLQTLDGAETIQYYK